MPVVLNHLEQPCAGLLLAGQLPGSSMLALAQTPVLSQAVPFADLCPQLCPLLFRTCCLGCPDRPWTQLVTPHFSNDH